MVSSEFGEDFAVKGEAALFQLRDEGGVRRVTVLADGGVEPDDPELAEIGLLITAVGESVAARAHQCLVSGVQLLRTDAAVAFRTLENILAALIGMYSTFDSCHTEMITLITLHRYREGSGGEPLQSD